jgi:hypothetical protein
MGSWRWWTEGISHEMAVEAFTTAATTVEVLRILLEEGVKRKLEEAGHDHGKGGQAGHDDG